MAGPHEDDVGTTPHLRTGWGPALLIALIVSTVGDEISLLTLMFRTAGDSTLFAVPMLLVAQLLPGLMVAPFAGRLVDNHDAGRLLTVVSVVEAGVLAWIAWRPDLASTLVGAAVLSICFAISGAGSFALIPSLAATLGMPLPRANALLELVRSSGMLVGPVAGGILVAWGGAHTALLLDAASFLLLAIILLGSGLRRPVAEAPDTAPRTLLSDYLPIVRNRRFAIMLGALAIEGYAVAIADVAFVFLITVTFAAGPPAFGMLTACWAGGMMVGAGIASALKMRQPAALALNSGSLIGATMLLIGVAATLQLGGLILIGLAFLAGGFANSVHNIAVRTVLQSEAPAELHGRVAAVYGAATTAATILGYVTGGLFTPDRAVDAYLLGGTLGVLAGGCGRLLLSGRSRG